MPGGTLKKYARGEIRGEWQRKGSLVRATYASGLLEGRNARPRRLEESRER